MAPQRQAASAKHGAAATRPAAAQRPRRSADDVKGPTSTPAVGIQKAGGWGAAGAGPGGTNPAIVQLKEMGFTEDVAKQALAACRWDVNKALDDLLTGRFVPRCDDSAVADSGAKTAAMPAAVGAGLPSASASTVSSPRSSSQAEKGTFASVEASAQDLNNVQSPNSPLSSELSGASELAQAESAAAGNSLDEDSEAAPVSKKSLERVAIDWPTETAGRLSVAAGEFVLTWIDTRTDIGWIYAERLDLEKSGSRLDGWIAVKALEPALPKGQRWMAVLQEPRSEHDTQLSVTAGAVVKVNVETQTPEGWVYAEAATRTRAGTGAPEVHEGWVPVFCLDWS